MERKTLEDMGLSKEQIDSIMDENGKDINKAKGDLDSAKAELKQAKDQLNLNSTLKLEGRSTQGRTYIRDLGAEGLEHPVRIEDFVEYISDGYECFVGDPKLLEKKDPVLYNYFIRRGLR